MNKIKLIHFHAEKGQFRWINPLKSRHKTSNSAIGYFIFTRTHLENLPKDHQC